MVEVDGSRCSTSFRIGIKIRSPDGRSYEHSFRLLFLATNNVFEYEAVLHGLKMIRRLGATNVTVRTDSQLVAHQASKEFAIKEPQIAKYVEILEGLSKQFEHLNIEQIPRTEINSIDALA